MSTAEIIAELPRLSASELAQVEAKLKELAKSSRTLQTSPIAAHPALGIWKDRADLPDDSIEASKQLRARMMRRTDVAES
jgi:hypothetical protein